MAKENPDDPAVVESVVASIGDVIDRLKPPLSPELISLGWNPTNQAQAIKLFTAWQEQIRTANGLYGEHVKIIMRWFDDAGIYTNTAGIGEAVMKIDNRIYDAVHQPRPYPNPNKRGPTPHG